MPMRSSVCIVAALSVIGLLAPSAAAQDPVAATLTTVFQMAPTPLVGQGPGPAGTLLLDALPGTAPAPFIVETGATTVTIPRLDIPLILQLPGPFACGAGGMCVPTGLVPGALVTVPFPGMTVALTSPVPDGCGTVTAVLPEPLRLSLTLPVGSLVMAVPAVGPQAGIPIPFTLTPPPLGIPFLPVSGLTIDVCPDTARTGWLTYDVSLEGTEWGWSVGGQWKVTVETQGGSGTAALTHTRSYLNPYGKLLSATDPAVAPMSGLTATHVPASAGGPAFRIQFAKAGGGAPHELTFEELVPTTGQTIPQNFPHVAMIALGQWMRQMGNPSLVVTAPVTGDAPVSWTVPVGNGAGMRLTWQMY